MLLPKVSYLGPPDKLRGYRIPIVNFASRSRRRSARGLDTDLAGSAGGARHSAEAW